MLVAAALAVGFVLGRVVARREASARASRRYGTSVEW